MYHISVEDHFEAAHFLRGYQGKCENLHGHRYRVMVHLKIRDLDETGMAYDFTELKRQLAAILANYDHRCLNDIPPFQRDNPTAENIAFTIYQGMLSDVGKKAFLDSVDVWESPGSCASYRPD